MEISVLTNSTVFKHSGGCYYDLNQIPYDYTVEGTNRFKGLDLVNRVSEELWTEVPNIVQEAMVKIIHPNEMQKGKGVV